MRAHCAWHVLGAQCRFVSYDRACGPSPGREGPQGAPGGLGDSALALSLVPVGVGFRPCVLKAITGENVSSLCGIFLGSEALSSFVTLWGLFP